MKDKLRMLLQARVEQHVFEAYEYANMAEQSQYRGSYTSLAQSHMEQSRASRLLAEEVLKIADEMGVGPDVRAHYEQIREMTAA